MPRTRFIFKTTRVLGGQTVHLRHRVPWLSNSATTTILNHLQTAKNMLSATIGVMNKGAIELVKTNAAIFFLIPNPPGPTEEQCERILNILQLTYHGLNSDVTLKLGADGNHGYVRPHRVPAGTPGSIMDGDGIHWTNEGHAIHIDKRDMLRNADLGVITLIHEATHKYANTLDYDDADDRIADFSYWLEPGLTTEQALNNAESYALFAFRVGCKQGY